MASPFTENQRGYVGLELISAMHKTIRRSDAEAALYFALEMLEADLGPHLLSRLRIILHEDVGATADPCLFLAAHASLQDLREMWPAKKSGWELALANTILAMCKARKARDADLLGAVVCHQRLTQPPRPIPPEALDHHTAAGVAAGRTEANSADESYRILPTDFTDTDLKRRGKLAFAWQKEAPGRSLEAKPSPIVREAAQRRPGGAR